MARIRRTTDKVKVQIDDIIVHISPLKDFEKASVYAVVMEASKSADVTKFNEAARLAMKYSIKDIEGVYLDDEGKEPYTLEFENGQVTDSCINDLLNMDSEDSDSNASQKLSAICSKLSQGGVKQALLDHENKPLDGVSIVKP